jgi:hypothetical protein
MHRWSYDWILVVRFYFIACSCKCLVNDDGGGGGGDNNNNNNKQQFLVLFSFRE